MRACDRCLARGWLLARLSGHLDRVRSRIDALLGLDDAELIDAVAGDGKAELGSALTRFDAGEARGRVRGAGLEAICRCDPEYPPRLTALPRPPSVLYVAGGLERCLGLLGGEPVAIVGARRASSYGNDVARSLGRGVASCGVTVVSGMALGVDSAAHQGALAIGGPTVAVLPGPADRPYPASNRSLHRRLIDVGAAVSELPPGVSIRRWMFPARNRIIAALSAMTVIVEAGTRSGALLTAACARELGRAVGAVPGRVSSPQAAGPNGLLSHGALLVRDAQDVLDALFGAGVRMAAARPRGELDAEQTRLLEVIARGLDTPDALARAGLSPEQGLAALGSLELGGHIRREPGGRFSVIA
jgi:DNA processing protein